MTIKTKILIGVFLTILIVFLFPKPCGRYTSAAVPVIEHKCYGLKTSLLGGAGGGGLFCIGICSSSKEPSFYCKEAKDCISGCGWRAYAQGCIAVNKNSKDYLERNKLIVEERFPLVCHENSCAFEINEMVIGFKAADSGKIFPYDMLIPESFTPSSGLYGPFLRKEAKLPEEKPEEIIVSSPTEGEIWVIGETYQIRWTPSDPTKTVGVILSDTRIPTPSLSKVWSKENIPDTGSYSFAVPEVFPGDAYQIYISSKERQGYSDLFSIVSKPEGVVITTVQNKYMQELDYYILFEVKNNSEKDIWYHITRELEVPDFKLERKTETKDWEESYFESKLKSGPFLKKLEVNKTAEGRIMLGFVGQKVREGYYEFIPGTYRISFSYINNPDQDWSKNKITVYSPEFVITTGIEDVNEWKVYRDEKYKYEIKYPLVFEMRWKERDIVKWGAFSCEQCQKDIFAPLSPNPFLTKEPFEVNGILFNQYRSGDRAAGQAYEYAGYCVERNGICYTFSITYLYGRDRGGSYTLPIEFYKILKILSTFRFLE